MSTHYLVTGLLCFSALARLPSLSTYRVCPTLILPLPLRARQQSRGQLGRARLSSWARSVRSPMNCAGDERKTSSRTYDAYYDCNICDNHNDSYRDNSYYGCNSCSSHDISDSETMATTVALSAAATRTTTAITAITAAAMKWENS